MEDDVASKGLEPNAIQIKQIQADLKTLSNDKAWITVASGGRLFCGHSITYANLKFTHENKEKQFHGVVAGGGFGLGVVQMGG